MNQTLSMDQVFLNKVTAIIEANLENEKFGVEELSHELGMSRSNINRKLKSIHKNSISELIREIRLQRAMEMLQQKVATASEIAFRVGFSSPTYFNKCFNEYYGFPPGEVKKLEAYDRGKSNHTAERPKRKKKFLRIVIPALVVIITLFCLSYFFKDAMFPQFRHATSIINKDSEKSIAVLPFINLSNDPEQEYFSDGMTEEILSHLFMIGGLNIPSSASTMRFKGTKLSLKEIARELGVSYVLIGNVSRAGDKVRIIVRLVNGKNELLLWTEEYNRAMTARDLHEIQSDVAQQVAGKMNVVINPEVKKRIEARPTENIEAYTLFLRAKDFKLPLDQAIPLLKKIILLDPEFADAYGELANYSMFYTGDSLSREQMLEIVEPLLTKALQLDKNSVNAHAVFAELRLWYYWDIETVEKEFQIFKQLNPSNSDAVFTFVQYLWILGRFREAHTLCKDYFDRDELSATKCVYMALSYSKLGEQEKALETIETALRLFPHHYFVTIHAIGIFVASAKYEEAIELFEKYTAGKELNDIEEGFLGNLAVTYFKIGNKNKATIFLNELLSRTRNTATNNSLMSAAKVYLTMDEKDKALQCLEKAYTNHESAMVELISETSFRPLRGDPRFKNLLKRIGFK